MAVWDSLKAIWSEASPRKRALLAGVPVAVLALVVVVIVVVAASGGGGDETAVAPTPRASATVLATPSAVHAGAKTPIATSPGDELTEFDLAQRGAGVPGRGEFLGDRLIIPSIGVDAPFSVKVVPNPGGQMPNPNGPSDIAYYDFSAWPLFGGVPDVGGNVVVAGHVDYINVGPAVFWDLDKLVVGDRVQIKLKDGTIVEYAIEFNKHIDATTATEKKMWDAIVAGTADESITLITCGGEFSDGHYSNRQILWGRRVT
jgi:LPXTG-site transpeptidase (sortase) family protein